MSNASELTADVVIIGGGAMGSATAYYLTQMGQFATGRVIIVERDTSYAECSTARSAGGIRAQFSTPENIALSKVTLDVVRNLKQVFGPDADVGFKEQGYLVLASSDGADTLRNNHVVQSANGGDIELLDPAGLKRKFPWLNVEGLALGAFGRSGEGWMDPSILMTLFRKAAQSQGATVIKDAVVGIDQSGSKVTGIRLASGQRIACGSLVCAAGHASGKVAKLAGIDLPVEPRKRYVYVMDCRDATPELHGAPLTTDASGVWFRPEGRQFITGISPDDADEPPIGDLDAIDYEPYENVVWPGVAFRAPAFEAVKMTGAWAGYYDYNTLDQNAIIGPHPEIGNIYFTTGFSGHGFQQSGGAGQAIAELIVHGGFRAIDLTRFGYERILRNEPIFELNIF
jgi:sarcosine oxidase